MFTPGDLICCTSTDYFPFKNSWFYKFEPYLFSFYKGLRDCDNLSFPFFENEFFSYNMAIFGVVNKGECKNTVQLTFFASFSFSWVSLAPPLQPLFLPVLRYQILRLLLHPPLPMALLPHLQNTSIASDTPVLSKLISENNQ